MLGDDDIYGGEARENYNIIIIIIIIVTALISDASFHL
jgi:hypothetical protein